jgi:hypothetical protein
MAWPNGPDEITPFPGSEKTEQVKTTTWTVSPYYKKSCEEHEQYVKDGMTIIRKTGYRGASFIVETNDGNPPEFEFDYVPGGDGAKDSLNMYDSPGSNIENVELDSMWDGCWEDIEFPEEMDDKEKERLQEIIEEEGDVYDVLENQEGWSQYETEAWIWGPILIEGDNGFRKIVVADEDGNCVEYEED